MGASARIVSTTGYADLSIGGARSRNGYPGFFPGRTWEPTFSRLDPDPASPPTFFARGFSALPPLRSMPHRRRRCACACGEPTYRW